MMINVGNEGNAVNAGNNLQNQINQAEDNVIDTGPRREISAFFATMLKLLDNQNPHRWLLDGQALKKYKWHEACTEDLKSSHTISDVNIIITKKVVPFLLEEMRQPSQVRKKFDLFVPDLPNLIEFNEVVERRKICHFLCDLETILLKHKMTDDMSNQITKWHGLFVSELSLELDNSLDVFKQYVNSAILFLRDPFGMPLDENALLGTDQNVYGTMGLTVALSLISKELRHKWPLEPSRAEIFITEPHPVVSFLVKSLANMQIILPNTDKLTADYLKLVKNDVVPLIPNKRTEKRRLMIEALEKNADKAIQGLEEFKEALKADKFDEEAKVAIDDLQRQFEQGKVEDFVRLDLMEQSRQEELQQLQALTKEHLENIQVLDEYIIDLEQFLGNLQEGVDEIKREQAILKIQLAQLIRENAKKRGSVFKSLCQIALLMLTTYAMGYLLPPNISAGIMKSGRGARLMLNAKF